VKNSTQP